MSESVGVYIRVSTVGQNEAGQRREIQRWLTGNGFQPEQIHWFIDKKSGDNLSRPAFEHMQQAIFNGEIRTVVVWKLDRISRKLRDGINSLCDWCDRGLRVVSVTQQIDFAGTVGKMIASVLFAVAELEQGTRRERQAAGIAVAKEKGVYKGRKVGSTKGKPSRAIELREKGNSISEIAAALGTSERTIQRYLASAQ